MITVVAAIIRRNDRILITQRSSDVHLAGLWEFPGGKVEPAESLDDALRREILEELGIRIRVGDE
jgi:mutator protein MutT